MKKIITFTALALMLSNQSEARDQIKLLVLRPFIHLQPLLQRDLVKRVALKHQL